MRVAGMLYGPGPILLGSLVLIIGYASAYPLQFLPPIPGYVPVYIRTGDQPLEEINLALAEAFHEKRAIEKNSVKKDYLEQVGPGHNVPNPIVEYEENRNSEESAAQTQKKNEAISLTLHPEEDEIGSPSDVKSEAVYPEDKHVKRTADDLEAVPNEGYNVNGATIPKLVSAQELHSQKASRPEQKDSFFAGKDHWNDNSKLIKRKPISVSKEAVIEVSSVPAKQKDDLEKLAAEVEKEEFRPNELVDPNPNYPELPAEVPQNHNSQDFGISADGLHEGNEKVANPGGNHMKYERNKPWDTSLEANHDAEKINEMSGIYKANLSTSSQEASSNSSDEDHHNRQTSHENGEEVSTH